MDIIFIFIIYLFFIKKQHIIDYYKISHYKYIW